MPGPRWHAEAVSHCQYCSVTGPAGPDCFAESDRLCLSTAWRCTSSHAPIGCQSGRGRHPKSPHTVRAAPRNPFAGFGRVRAPPPAPWQDSVLCPPLVSCSCKERGAQMPCPVLAPPPPLGCITFVRMKGIAHYPSTLWNCSVRGCGGLAGYAKSEWFSSYTCASGSQEPLCLY